jgi:hypothetical protein
MVIVYVLTFTDSFLRADCGAILHRVQCEIDLWDRLFLSYSSLHGYLHGEGHLRSSRGYVIQVIAYVAIVLKKGSRS